ncbi:MAG: putative molybdenum carrier protein [Rhodothermales bacterium]
MRGAWTDVAVITGGQTGVDRAALDIALALGIPAGGWCPKGRRAEDGPLPARYPLRETPLPDYAQRTRWNVRDSDGTLVLTLDPPQGGTALTVREARRLGKPVLVVDLARTPPATDVQDWTKSHHIRTLNIAGPRVSEAPDVYEKARAYLESLYSEK